MSNRRLMIFPAVAISAVALSVGLWTILPSRPAVGSSPVTVPVANTPTFDSVPINLRRTVTVQVVQKTKDAVVNISTTKLVAQRMYGNDPFLQQFEGGPIVLAPANSLGSGFIVHPDGYVVTNNHVIDHARQITVELADGRKLPAELISADPDADLAVLRVHSPAPLPTMELGESNDLMIGEPVIAIGNPLGFSHSVSSGIVSAVHRDIDPRRAEQNAGNQPAPRGEDAALRDLIQTDAAINPGNSGGPLLNAYGQVIGINTAVVKAQNIGFAIPIDRLRDLIPELMNPTQTIKVDIPIKLAERRTMTEPATVNVTVVENDHGGAALQTIDGRRPADVIDAYAMLLRSKPGQSINFTWASGKVDKVAATAAPIPDAIVQAKRLMGLTVQQNTPILANQYQNPRDDGILITGVDPDGVAARSKLRPGDVIFRVGRFPTATLNDFGALVPRFPKTGQVQLLIQRGNQQYRAVIELQPPQ